MKILKYFLMIHVGIVSILHAQHETLKKYENEITDIREIAGITSYSLVLSCTQLNPIVVYAPQNFYESGQGQVHRYLLPNTTLSQTVDHEHAVVQQDGPHVEVLLFGQLLLQTTGDHKANFMVSVK